jgi:hypothetical protein
MSTERPGAVHDAGRDGNVQHLAWLERMIKRGVTCDLEPGLRDTTCRLSVYRTVIQLNGHL